LNQILADEVLDSNPSEPAVTDARGYGSSPFSVESSPLSSRARENTRLVWKGRVRQGVRSCRFCRAALAPSFDASDWSQHSPNVDEAFAGSPSPRGRGRGEGEGVVRFPSRPLSFKSLLLPCRLRLSFNSRSAIRLGVHWRTGGRWIPSTAKIPPLIKVHSTNCSQN